MKRLSTAALIVIASCTAYKQISLSNLELGMTKQQAITALGRKPDNLIGAKGFPTGTIEVLQYTRLTSAHNYIGEVAEQYWLYFWNDTLKQWGRPGDWEKEADKIYEVRLNATGPSL